MVQFQEPYDVNAYRELEEEMGIREVELRAVGSPFFYQNDHSQVWGAIFEATCRYDGPLKLQEDEVDEVLLMTLDEILAHSKDFTPDGIHALELYMRHI